MSNCIVVTGGAGFIGSAMVRHLLANTDYIVVNIDKLTYAGNLDTLKDVMKNRRHAFRKLDVADREGVDAIFREFRPHALIHLAAESHVDRSIDGPLPFIETNIVGTYQLLEASRAYWTSLPEIEKKQFRYQHVSTDEVFGSLDDTGAFTESTPYQPRSPYSASKAASDHLVRAWHETFGLPTMVSNCSNNYGPYQFPEKLIPVVITKALQRQPIPVYGTGSNIRDWLYVEDHAGALFEILTRGRVGETYNVGGNAERRNLDVVYAVCDAVDQRSSEESGRRCRDLVTFVTDRPGHDYRYAIDAGKISAELGWKPSVRFEDGVRLTVDWYCENMSWVENVRRGKYAGERLGSGVSR